MHMLLPYYFNKDLAYHLISKYITVCVHLQLFVYFILNKGRVTFHSLKWLTLKFLTPIHLIVKWNTTNNRLMENGMSKYICIYTYVYSICE